jgi:copper(I)-binding protein
MKTYYAIVNVENRWLGTYVPAADVAAAFVTAAAKYKRRHPLIHVETITVQEMAGDYVGWRLGRNSM